MYLQLKIHGFLAIYVLLDIKSSDYLKIQLTTVTSVFFLMYIDFCQLVVNLCELCSMPLIVEWSASPPHDLILAGCHDGVVGIQSFNALHVSCRHIRLFIKPLSLFPMYCLSPYPLFSSPNCRNDLSYFKPR